MERKLDTVDAMSPLEYVKMLRRLGNLDAPVKSRDITHQEYNLSSFDLGERVRIIKGPNKGIEGIVIVERNGNYEDAYSSHSPESMAILILKEEYDFSMDTEIASDYLKKLGFLEQEVVENTDKLADAGKTLELKTVWVESPDNLTPIESGQNSH